MLRITHKFIVLTFGFLFTLSKVEATEYIQFTEDNIAHVRTSLKQNTAHTITKQAYIHLLNTADNMLVMKPPSVIDKTLYPPTKNKHDYLSISRYWWPDPDTENGLPWIRKDGVTNPSTQTDDVDRKRLGKLVHGIKVLSLAYYFSDDDKYAEKGVELINTWFLNEKTKMNPHFTYSQSVPGNPKPRRSGILDGRLIPERVLDAITMFSKSTFWTKQKNIEMNKWLNDYLTWLTTSKLGLAGAKQVNNHGSWYRFQVASLAWYLGKGELLTQTINSVKNNFSEQLTLEGSQLHELARTRGFFYSCFNLKALTLIANIAEKVNLSLWQYQTTEGHSLKVAVDYLMPVIHGERWPHTSKNLDVTYLAPILGEIMIYKPEKQYEKALVSILQTLNEQKILKGSQQNILFEFALFNPKYFR